jgi:hypothetical protein
LAGLVVLEGLVAGVVAVEEDAEVVLGGILAHGGGGVDVVYTRQSRLYRASEMENG